MNQFKTKTFTFLASDLINHKNMIWGLFEYLSNQKPEGIAEQRK